MKNDILRLKHILEAIDFINLKIWPAFNIADAAITVGVIGLILYLIKKE